MPLVRYLTDALLGPTDIVSCPDKYTWGVSFDDGPSPYSMSLFASRPFTMAYAVTCSHEVTWLLDAEGPPRHLLRGGLSGYRAPSSASRAVYDGS